MERRAFRQTQIRGRAAASAGLTALVVLAIALGLSIAPLTAQDADAVPPFGAVEVFWLPEVACETGIAYDRIIFDWAQHQPTGPDDWNPHNVDEQWLRTAAACDRSVIAVIKHTPAWATDGRAGIGVPRGLYLPVDDPDNLWARFLRRAAEVYAPLGVNRFIIWNEPDIREGVHGFEFEGTLEDYAQMLRVAYHALRAGNPNAIVHLAGTTYWHDVNLRERLYVDRLLEVLAADPEAAEHGFYFDVLTLHIYFRVETVYQIVHEMRGVLERYGLGDKSIWIGEMNASPNRDPLWPVERPNWQITLDQQASFLLQGAALGFAAGADHMAAYKFFDWSLEPGAESFALIRVDQSPRPALTTWGFAIDELSNVTAADFVQSPLIDAVYLRRQDGAPLLIAWARTADAALLALPADSPTRIADQYGNMMETAPADGAITLLLPGAVCNRRDRCPVGGLPVVVWLAGDTPPALIDLTSDAALTFELAE